jgi:plasmid stabilization system protein ParE
MNVVFREEALTDLEEIADYVSQQNAQVAARTIARIHRVIYKTLCTLPLGGRLNPTNNTREYAVPGLPYLIVYLPVPTPLTYSASSTPRATRPPSLNLERHGAEKATPLRFAAMRGCGTLRDMGSDPLCCSSIVDDRRGQGSDPDAQR